MRPKAERKADGDYYENLDIDDPDHPHTKTKRRIVERREKYRPLVNDIVDLEGSVLHSILKRPASSRQEIADTIPSKYSVFYEDPLDQAIERAVQRYGARRFDSVLSLFD